MPRVSGQYTLPPGYFAVSGEIIQPSQHNPPLEDIAQALTDSLPRDGSAGMSGNLPMGGNRITGLAAATAAGHAPRYDQVVPVTGGTVTGHITFSNSGWMVNRSGYSIEAGANPSIPFGAKDGSGNITHIIWQSDITDPSVPSTVASILNRQMGDGRYMQQSWNITAGDGLTGGGNGSANRSLAVDGTVVRTSRQISTGQGLTGGGNLSSNRTLGLNFNQFPQVYYSLTEPTIVAMDGSNHIRIGEVMLRANFNLAGSGTTITAGAGLTGGGTLANNRTLSIDVATVNEARAGAVNNKVMTPLRVAQSVIGISQSWTAPSRSANTVYQNTTGRPIMVNIAGFDCLYQVSTTGSGAWVTVGRSFTATDGTQGQSFIVPNGHYYRANLQSGSPAFEHWAELR